MPNFVEKSCEFCGSTFVIAYKLRSKQTCSKECSYKLRMIKRKETNSSTGGVPKKCSVCGVEYLDPTRKSDMTQCRPCSYAQMVETRNSNGSYSRSEESNKQLSDTLKKKYAEGWNPNTPEHREKLSLKMKERWKSGKMRNGPHWTQTAEGKQRLSALHRGRVFTDSALLNMRKGAASRLRNGRLKTFRGKGGVREDIGFYVRSAWEANFARVLKYEGKNFEYESVTFTLKSGRTYTPDFKVDNCYYEVKGWMTPAAKQKIEEFVSQYPDSELKIIGPSEYNELRSVYGGLINWE